MGDFDAMACQVGLAMKGKHILSNLSKKCNCNKKTPWDNEKQV